MTALYIILAVIGIITVLLHFRVGVIISYNSDDKKDALKLSVSYLFMRIKLLPKNNKVKLSDYTYKKVEKRKEQALKKENKKKNSKKDGKDKKASVKKGRKKEADNKSTEKKTNIVKLIFDIRELIFDVIKAFPTKLRLDISRLKLRIGCEDAAKTAITYGAVTEGVGALITLLESSPIKTKRGHDHEIMITPDFLSGKTDADVKIKISIAPSAVIAMGFRFIFDFIKYKISTLKTK